MKHMLPNEDKCLKELSRYWNKRIVVLMKRFGGWKLTKRRMVNLE